MTIGVVAVFENLWPFVEAAAFGSAFGFFPWIIEVVADADALSGELGGRGHFGDVEILSVGFRAVPSGPDGVEFALVLERGHVDGPEVLFFGVAGLERSVEFVFAERVFGF